MFPGGLLGLGLGLGCEDDSIKVDRPIRSDVKVKSWVQFGVKEED